MGEVTNAYRLSGKPKRRTWVYNIKMDIEKYGVGVWRVELCGHVLLRR
jgi:hypothetical protein